MLRLAGLVLTALAALAARGCVTKVRVASPEAACALASAQVTALRGLPKTHVAVCDNIPEADGLDGYYILALFAQCQEDVCGSTNMGWFAIRKATGEISEWNVAEWKLERPIGFEVESARHG